MPRVSQQHLDDRRQQILDAATRCFTRNGFHATSMQDVLAEANLSAGAVYRYFRGKDEIIAAIATTAMSTVANAFTTVATPDPTSTDPLPPIPDLLAGVFATVEAMDREHGTGRMVIQVWAEALRDPILAEQITSRIRTVGKDVTKVVERYQERGLIADTAPAESVARTLIALLPGFIVQRALLGDVTAETFRDGLRALLPPAPDAAAGNAAASG